MTELTSFQWISIVLTIGGLVISLISWLLLQLLSKQKEFQAIKDEYNKELDAARLVAEDTKFDRLIDQIKHLVAEIKTLFQKHDDHAIQLRKQSDELGKLSTSTALELTALRADMAKQYDRCTRREAYVEEKLNTNRSSTIGGHRMSDPCGVTKEIHD